MRHVDRTSSDPQKLSRPSLRLYKDNLSVRTPLPPLLLGSIPNRLDETVFAWTIVSMSSGMECSTGAATMSHDLGVCSFVQNMHKNCCCKTEVLAERLSEGRSAMAY